MTTTGLPDTRDLTLYAGSQIPSATLNRMQDEEVRLWRAIRGGDFFFGDDFEGAALNNRWGVTGSQVSMQPDATPGGAVGAVQLAADASHLTQRILTQKLGLTTRAFRAMWRARVTGAISATGTVRVGFSSPGAGHVAADYLHLYATQGTNWKLNLGSAVDIDTGVAPSTSYQKIEMRRDDAGGFLVLIDGVQVYSGTFASSLVNAQALAECNEVSNATTLLVDAVKVWVPRESSTLGATSTQGHDEGGVVAMTSAGSGAGVDFYDVVFATPYPNGYTYQFSATASPSSASADGVSVDVVSRTTTGMRLRPSAPFDGVISWSAR